MLILPVFNGFMSKVFRIFVIFFSLHLLSCGSGNKVKLPTGIVPPDTMVTIVSDIHIMQATAAMGFSTNNSDTAISQEYKGIWLKHHLTEESYNENIKFYCEHPKLLDSVYEKVLNNLNMQKAKLMGTSHFPRTK